MIKIAKHLLPLFIVQFFTWLGLFALWIYATPVITRYIFGALDAQSSAFENGTAWVGICFALYSTLAALLVFIIPKVEKITGKEKLHAIALIAGAVGLLLIYFIKNKYMLFLSFAFIGIAWSSISTIPYSIVSSIAPEESMTNYFAVFNFSVVIPQVTAAFLFGYINHHFLNGNSIYIMPIGSFCMLIAGIVMFFVKYKVYQPELIDD
ncbi:MAG: hypothetical protein JSU03_02020 [Bacteroidetes bacterium]|nr:hypothetical protein [Bacteroidota bacterium]